jgi:glycosyltransferase involved in cell wall biosynthesis
MDGIRKVALVTNIPAPYRVAVFEQLARLPGLHFKVFFFAGSEPDRNWGEAQQTYDHAFLRERVFKLGARFVHVNPDVWSQLRAFRPDVVITTGFNPTHLLAFLYARLHGAKHVAMTDGTPESEAVLSAAHRWVRRWVYRRTDAFVGASQASLRLFQAYGAPGPALFQSHLCADNARFDAEPAHAPVHDFLFCGRFVSVKNPMFAMDVAQACAHRLRRRVSLAFLGAGELEPQMRARAAELDGVDVRFLSFAQPDALPGHYKRALVFLFPTSWDPWGVVANEACASGVPVLTTVHAGSAGEIVLDGVNGAILPLEVEAWAHAACRLLQDADWYAAQSEAGRRLVRGYTFEAAAQGLHQAATYALKERA